MNLDSSNPHASWPFPVAGYFRKSAASRPAESGDESTPTRELDPVEQELVAEQRERDRKASLAVDPDRKDRPSS